VNFAISAANGAADLELGIPRVRSAPDVDGPHATLAYPRFLRV